jgi:CheY-like chemotaxis protein
MDHMMPEVDGVEATAAIRAWEAETGREPVPIVALTANAISGMREMFLESGFSDFLAKPIDSSKLDEIVAHWMPKEKRAAPLDAPSPNGEWQQGAVQQRAVQQGAEGSAAPLPAIPGLDIQKGISMTGGTVPLYLQVVRLFRCDAEERLPFLQSAPEEADLPKFITQVHALKSASASIGAAGISAMAAELEAAADAGDVGFVKECLPSFAESLAALVAGVRAWEGAEEHGPSSAAPDPAEAERLLHELAAALEAERAGDIDAALEGLMRQALGAEAREVLKKISDSALVADFAAAAETVRSLLASGALGTGG